MDFLINTPFLTLENFDEMMPETANDEGTVRVIVGALERTFEVPPGFLADLRLAAKYGLVQVLQQLLATVPPDIDLQASADYLSILNLAVENGHQKVAALLLAQSQPTASSACEILKLAIKHGCDEIVAILLDLYPSIVHADDLPALHLAAQYGQRKIIELLLACNPESIDVIVHPRRWTVLHYAALNCDNCEVVTALLTQSPKLISQVDSSNQNALFFAADSGNELIVAQLLALQPNLLDVEDRDGWNAFHAAASRGHTKVLDRCETCHSLSFRL